MKLRYLHVLREIQESLQKSDLTDGPTFIKKILESKVHLTIGAGRVGIAMQAFAKRLNHLGLESFHITDTSIPMTGPGDILIVGSGSGSTPSVITHAEVARSCGLDVVLITSSPGSPLTKLASATLVISAPNRDSEASFGSIQPMTTLFEQTLGILLDSIVLDLMDSLGESSNSMRMRHNVIE